MPKMSGAALATFALEQIGVRFTFGIPGVHNTEIYDELAKSEKIRPILVTHEQGASFMADGVSRMGGSIGTLLIVPAAGLTHAMSGIGEAFLDGIPMLVISGGTRRDTGRSFQLHQLDQLRLAQEITKKAWVVADHASIIPTIYEAYELATSGTPGPVLVEIPVELQMFRGDVEGLPTFKPRYMPPGPTDEQITEVLKLLSEARRPGLYLGWGARDCTAQSVAIADQLVAPVATTMQGLSVFPANHRFHTGMGFGHAAVPAAEQAFKDCDCLLTVGARFGELATASYGLPVPAKLIHVDINKDVFNKNFPATVAIESDATNFMKALAKRLNDEPFSNSRSSAELASAIRSAKERSQQEWLSGSDASRVNPAKVFNALRRRMRDDAVLVADDGNHTFLTAELFPVHQSRGYISPTDFNAMGYAVPASIGAKLSNPLRQVVAVVGDGGFLMTGMEMLTATTQQLGIIYVIFNDGELGQISQFQQTPLNRKTCTVLESVRFEGMAMATGAEYLWVTSDGQLDQVLDSAFAMADGGRPVVVDVQIDYSRKTRFTQGVVKTNLSRFPLAEKVRFIARAARRHVLG